MDQPAIVWHPTLDAGIACAEATLDRVVASHPEFRSLAERAHGFMRASGLPLTIQAHRLPTRTVVGEIGSSHERLRVVFREPPGQPRFAWEWGRHHSDSPARSGTAQSDAITDPDALAIVRREVTALLPTISAEPVVDVEDRVIRMINASAALRREGQADQWVVMYATNPEDDIDRLNIWTEYRDPKYPTMMGGEPPTDARHETVKALLVAERQTRSAWYGVTAQYSRTEAPRIVRRGVLVATPEGAAFALGAINLTTVEDAQRTWLPIIRPSCTSALDRARAVSCATAIAGRFAFDIQL